MRTARFLAAVVAPLVIVACAVGTAPVDTGSGDEIDSGSTVVLDGNYGTVLPDGQVVLGGDAALHGGVDSGGTAVDSGKTVTPPVDSGSSTPPPSSDECPSGNTTLYDIEWGFSETPCTPGDGDCDPGDCCFDRNAGSGDPYCITP